MTPAYHATGRRTEPREWFCLHCGKTVESVELPDGWLILKQVEEEDRRRRGIFCTYQCLGSALRRLAAQDRQRRALR